MAETIYIPVAVGELYDKISILEIKLARIQDSEKLKNISIELITLQEIAAALGYSSRPEVRVLRARLKLVNEAIWDSEELVRDIVECDRFDITFAAAARRTHENNDQRAAIKRELNLLLGSRIIEEKSHIKKP